VFGKLQALDGKTGRSFSEIEETLRAFNKQEEYSKTKGEGVEKFNKDFKEKIKLLQAKLDEWGIKDNNGKDVVLTSEKSGGYNLDTAKENRNKNLCENGKRLKQSDFPGTILPKEGAPC
jgi:hypothetical protein